MTGTLISLISILAGIIAANSAGSIFNKYSFGIIGNTLAGVFGSILVIKFFGRLGFNPWFVMNNGSFDGVLFIINMFFSAVGGILGLLLAKLMYNKMNI